jgi:hypothetical protein
MLPKSYITIIKSRLIHEGYQIRNDVKNKSLTIQFFAKKTKFDLIRGGFFSNIIAISFLANPSLSELKEYSSNCYKLVHKVIRFHPPRGLMYGFLCLPVAVVEKIDNETCNSIKLLDMPKHWASEERLVVFDTSNQELYYSEKRPYWGYMYHDLDNSIINYLLSPKE